MFGQVQLIFLLAIAACVVQGAPLTEENPSIKDGEKWNLDKVVDTLLPTIRTSILESGMDPLALVDISEPILPDLPGAFKGKVDLKKGWMQNLSLIKRTNHVTAEYKNKRLTFDMNFGFDVLDVSYQYDLRYLLYKRQGDMNGRLHKLDINVVMTIDLNEYYLILESMKFSDARKLEVKFEGHLLDPILNGMTKMITKVFQNSVLKFIENYAMKIFKSILNDWNTKIPLQNRTEIINGWLNIIKNASHN